MAAVDFEYVLELAEQLKPEEQTALIERLRARQSGQVSREMLLAEFERRKAAGLFDHAQSLYGKFIQPKVDLSAEELDATLREAGRAWEEELDDFADGS